MSAPALRLVPPDPAAAIFDDWEMFGLAAGWAPKTISMRRLCVRQLARHAGVRPEDVTTRQVAYWLATFTAPATRASYYRSARAFYTWLVATGQRVDNPTGALPRPREPRHVPRPVRTADLARALEGVRTGRAYAYIVLGAYAGLRVHEIAKVRGDDVDVVEKTLHVVGKGAVEASLPMHPRLVRLAHGMCDDGWWFPSGSASGHVGAATVSQTIQLAFARVDVKMTAHQLRHWYGTQILRAAGGNLRVAQECLRHASPATTAQYTLVEDVERRRAVDKLV